jgi:hypothetical protein
MLARTCLSVARRGRYGDPRLWQHGGNVIANAAGIWPCSNAQERRQEQSTPSAHRRVAGAIRRSRGEVSWQCPNLHQHWCGSLFRTLPVSYADCARLRTRLLISRNSETSARVFRPARVAASISVVNKMVVARSALQARQHLSVLPGRSKSSLIRPHMQQEPIRF